MVDPTGEFGIPFIDDIGCFLSGATTFVEKQECGERVEEDLTENPVAQAAEYCTDSLGRVFECYERLEVAATGVAVTAFGVWIGIGGCAIVGGAAVEVGGAVFVPVICGTSAAVGTVVAGTGVLLTTKAFEPWHHGE